MARSARSGPGRPAARDARSPRAQASAGPNLRTDRGRDGTAGGNDQEFVSADLQAIAGTFRGSSAMVRLCKPLRSRTAMKPMTCNEVDEHLELFAAGECGAPLASAIRRHLSGCVRCLNAEVEARQFMEMMNLRLQEPDRLQRLLTKIEGESSFA